MNLRPYLLALIAIAGLGPNIGNATESPDSKLVLLGVQQQGRPNERLSRAIERRMERMVEPYRLPHPALTADQKTCRALECLLDIAQAQQADRLLGSDLSLPMDQLAVITVWLFDARSRQSAEEEARCEQCDAAGLEEAVANAAARLLEKFPASTSINTGVKPTVRAVQLPGSPEQPKTCPEADCRSKELLARKRQTRLIAASVFGSLLSVALLTSISLTAVDTSGEHLCKLTSDLSMRSCPGLPAFYGAGYALSAVLAGGLALSLAIPIK